MTKFLLRTDRGLDLRDFKTVLETVLARTRPETDLHIFCNTAMDTFDYTGPEVNLGSTGVWWGDGDPVRKLPSEYRGACPVGCVEVEAFCGGCLVVDGPDFENEPDYADRLIDWAGFKDWPVVVIVDHVSKALATTAAFLWRTFTRFEPAADIHAGRKVHRNHLCYEFPIVIDARMKPNYPKELVCDPDTAKLITRRWAEYFPEGGVEMGDSNRGHLDCW